MESSVAGVWLAVVASGVYHGFNPAMGWPLAVSAGLMGRNARALGAALWPLTIGHLLAVLTLILPFALLVALVQWQRPIRIGAAVLVISFGIVRLVHRRHPRALARLGPAQLGLWSFAMAVAHGAALMLVPIYLGMCRATETDAGHVAASTLMQANVGTALLVACVHSLAMVAAGGMTAWLIYRYCGLKYLSRGWVNTDVIWAATLIAVGALSLQRSL